MIVRSRCLLPAALALAAALTACTTGSAPSEQSSGDGLTVRHIHGVGVDPADGRLYVATHDGVITRSQDGKAELVGDDQGDFMGFAVAGEKTFLASGHPTVDSDEPAHRGLIKSTDAGKTWKNLSLAGEADFHDLNYAHSTIYGYDSTSGRLRVSQDGKTWKDRAKLEALDIVVSPEKGNVILATTQQGIAASTDGGASFTPGRAPAMMYLSWPKAEALFGIDPSGKLGRSKDGGKTWQTVSTVPGGQPQALTAVSADHLVAATQNGVYESRDGGRTFTKSLAVSSGDGH